MLPAPVEAFRREYRAREIGPRYSGGLHLAFTSGVSLLVIAVAVVLVQGPRPLELAVVPATFLFANLVEYLGHRGPMHRLAPWLGLLFERHTRQHHRFYTHDSMSYESARDYKIVLFPPVMLVFFLGAIATPLGLLLWRVASSNAALLYVATAMAYFLTYEWLHFCHHLPEGSLLRRLPGLAALRAHHAAHHDPALMGQANFNITFPICDALFGTRTRP